MIVPTVTMEAAPLTDPEVGFVTPTQAGDQVTPFFSCNTPARRNRCTTRGGAHQAPFNLDDVPQNTAPMHIHYSDLGEPHDPAAPELGTRSPRR